MQTTRTSAPARPAARRFARHAAVALSVSLALAGCGSKEEAAGKAAHSVPTVPAPSGPNRLEPATPAIPATPAATPRQAIDGFLAAEISGDFAASFGYLSNSDRATAVSVGSWTQAHETLPIYTSYSVESDNGPTVVTQVSMMARLDETAGEIASSATVTWTTVQEGGGWSVKFSSAKVAPNFPDPTDAPAAALAWVAAAQAGTPDTSYEGALLGNPEVVTKLAKLPGTFTAEPIEDLAAWPNVAVVTNAFGSDAVGWAKVVPVDGPVGLDLVVAPLADRWVVVAAVAR